jgi:hypothetical protein
LLHIRERPSTALRLGAASIGALHDDRLSWPDKGHLHLQGLVAGDLILHQSRTASSDEYRDLTDVVRLNAADRIEWLLLQPSDDLDKAQPWIQVGKVLKENGDTDGAKKVTYTHRRVKARSHLLRRLSSWPLHWISEQPIRIGLPIVALWLLGSLVFWQAQRIGAMAPSDRNARADLDTKHALPAGYPTFNPVVYTLENVLPVVKLGQDANWAPDHNAAAGTWLPDRPAWLRQIADKWQLTRWFFRLNYARLASLRWGLILTGWILAGILTFAIGEQFKQ